jgi:hypothetical protein
MLVDSPTILVDGEMHRDAIVRSAILVHPGTGELVSLNWRIDIDGAEAYLGVNGSAVQLEPNLVTTFPVHVDGSHVFAGIPTPKAFAVPGLPPGKRIEIPLEVREIAGRKLFNEEMFRELEAALCPLVGFTRSRENHR